MLVIVEVCKHWKHYLKSAVYNIQIATNYLNFHKFLTTKTFLQHKTKWWERFSGLNLAIKYCEGKNNPANRPFQRPN